MDLQPAPEHLSDENALGVCFEDVERHQYELNRSAARRAAAMADAIGFAREHPQIYALPRDPDPVGTAERCAVMEAASRFQLSENVVRGLAHTADTARADLAALWARAWEGFAPLALIDAAIAQLPPFDAQPPEALRAFDAALADLALDCSPALFRAKVRKLADRLAPVDPVVEHSAARERRTVIIEKGEAGMAWVHLHTPTVDALAIKRRLTSTAKHVQRSLRDGRSRDQIRSDLATSWLKGTGTPTAVKTVVHLTVPVDLLSPEAQSSVRRDLPVPAGAPDLNAGARLDTGDAVDRVTAMRMLLEAGRFTRVITDPVSGVILDMDRRARTATRQQREWLVLTHGTCTRDGCTHAAAESDVDHWNAFHGAGRGPTSIGNLHPFCAPENQVKEKSRFRYQRRDDGTVQLVSPTGYSTRPPRPGEREAAELMRRLRAGDVHADSSVDPPF